MLILVTGAEAEPRRERAVEYTLCLHKLFHSNEPVVGVVSECSDAPTVFDAFPFRTLLKVRTGELEGMKSHREVVSMRRLMQEVEVADDVFVVKVSGRYLLLDDSFLDAVRRAGDADAVLLHEPSVDKMYTFLFAIRAKWLREFLARPFGLYDGVEGVLYDYLKSKKVVYVNRLGVLANINSEGGYRVF
jgi:hypothetical protein